jgi:hypothetical protein
MLSPLLSTPGTMTATTTNAAVTPDTWREWLSALFPSTYSGPMAPYHADFWDWLWEVPEVGAGPDGHTAYVAIWARGWGKSTNIETGTIALGAHSRRRYGWYISSRQSQADDHIGTVSAKIADSKVAQFYPELASARVQVIGERSRQMGWRRNRIWTADGFAIDALGLDSAIRGAKLGDQRPDFMIFDDVDEELDTEGTIERKIAVITRRIIPAAAPGCIYLVGQNLVHPDGIVSRLADGRATYLGSRTVSGPHPAIAGLKYEGGGTEAVITAGAPTWEVMGLEVCQQKIEDAGIDSFLAECQHEVNLIGNPRFSRDAIAVHEENVRSPLPRSILPEWAHDEYLSVWSLPIAGVPYVMYFDGAEGVGGDYCATTVVRADTLQLVALLRDNKREQREHAKVAATLWHEYNRGLMGWERSHEADFAAVMAEEGVNRIYEHPEEQTTAQRINQTPPTKHRGYPARNRERRILVARIARYLERHEGVIPSEVVLTEAKRFVRTARKPDGEAGSGSHDDALFSFGGALIMADHPGARTVREASGQSNVRGYAPGSVPLAAGRRPTTRAY